MSFDQDLAMLSPASVYHLSYSTNSSGCQPEEGDQHGEKCRDLIRLAWMWENETCQGTLVCTVLEGNPCGSYALSVSVPWNNAITQLLFM